MPTMITRGAASAKAYGFTGGTELRTCGTFSGSGPYTVGFPSSVRKISIVAVGAGGHGGSGWAQYHYCCYYCYYFYYFYHGGSGGGGALAYVNNYSISPSQTINLYRGCCGAYSVVIGCTTVVSAGNGVCGANGYCGGGGGGGGTVIVGAGGAGGGGNYGGLTVGSPSISPAAGGGGAGGYSGNGGCGNSGGNYCNYTNGSGGGGSGGNGGGVGIEGQGASGCGRGSPGSYVYGTNHFCYYGNGGCGSSGFYGSGWCGWTSYCGGAGQSGAIRMVAPGNKRTFPSTDVGYP